jgi:TFIIS helical bundle-like domain
VDIGVFVTDDFLRATKVGIVINRLTRNENENPAIAKLARKIISKMEGYDQQSENERTAAGDKSAAFYHAPGDPPAAGASGL